MKPIVLHNTSFRMTIFMLHFGETLKTRFLKSCTYDCSALKKYTTVQFSGDDSMSSSLVAAKPLTGEPLSSSDVLDVDATTHIITISLHDTLPILGRPLSHSGVGDASNFTYPTSRGVAPIKRRLTSYYNGRYTADNGLYDPADVCMSSTFPGSAEGNDWEDPTCLDVEASCIPSTQRRPTYAVESTDSRPTTQRYSDDTDQHMVDPVSRKLLSGRPVVGRLYTISGRHTPDIRFRYINTKLFFTAEM